MFFHKFAMAGLVLLFASGTIFAQLVEKLSASFTFPTTITTVAGKQVSPAQALFFRTAGNVLRKGIVTLEWSVPPTSEKGHIAVFSVSGALVKNLVLTRNQGSLQCDMSKAATGIYLVNLSYGSYRQNLKLALYR
jgi:Secretion system C-terminal sorting domain